MPNQLRFKKEKCTFAFMQTLDEVPFIVIPVLHPVSTEAMHQIQIEFAFVLGTVLVYANPRALSETFFHKS